MTLARLSLTIIIFWLVTPANAQIYKSVDANGRTVFSDAPPPMSTSKVTVVKTAPPPASAAQRPTDWAAKDAEIRERIRKRQETEASSNGPLVAKCEAAKTQVDAYNRTRGGTYTRRDADGNQYELSNAEREEFEAKIREVAERRCR